MVAEIGMVAGQDKDGIAEPRLTADCLEEFADGHIGIADALVHDDTLFGELLLILLWNTVGMMARCREDCCHERLLHLRHLGGIVLQERLVPDGPCAVVVVIVTEA